MLFLERLAPSQVLEDHLHLQILKDCHALWKKYFITTAMVHDTNSRWRHLPEVTSTMTFMATYSYWSTLRRLRCSVKFNMRSMQGLNPRSWAWAKLIDLPWPTRISPGVLMERKQQDNNRSSHHALRSRAIWSSIWKWNKQGKQGNEFQTKDFFWIVLDLQK